MNYFKLYDASRAMEKALLADIEKHILNILYDKNVYIIFHHHYKKLTFSIFKEPSNIEEYIFTCIDCKFKNNKLSENEAKEIIALFD